MFLHSETRWHQIKQEIEVSLRDAPVIRDLCLLCQHITAGNWIKDLWVVQRLNSAFKMSLCSDNHINVKVVHLCAKLSLKFSSSWENNMLYCEQTLFILCGSFRLLKENGQNTIIWNRRKYWVTRYVYKVLLCLQVEHAKFTCDLVWRKQAMSGRNPWMINVKKGFKI